jgi:hypothetical protein
MRAKTAQPSAGNKWLFFNFFAAFAPSRETPIQVRPRNQVRAEEQEKFWEKWW